MIVPHARDEQRFDPARYDRDAVRRELGVGPYDRLLLFGGTPRAHKGVVEVLEALERLGDDRYKLALFGIGELAKLGSRVRHLERWVAAAAVPALRRAGAARRRRRPLVRPPGPHAPGRALPDAGEDRRCARHGRAVPGDGHAAAATARRRGRGPRARSGRAAPRADRIDLRRPRRRPRPRPEGPRALPRRVQLRSGVGARRAVVRAARAGTRGAAERGRRAGEGAPEPARGAHADEGPRRRRPGRAGARSRIPPLACRAGRAVRPRRLLEAERHVDLRTPPGHVPEVPAADRSVRQDRALRQSDLARDPHPHLPGEHRDGWTNAASWCARR